MKTILLLILCSILLVSGCDSNQSVTKPKAQEKPQPVEVVETPEPVVVETEKTNAEIYKKLIFNTKLSISPSQPNWVLFSNGTYILLPSGLSDEVMRKNATTFLNRYNGESLSITKSPLVKGWIAGSSQGIYNYVSPDEVGDRIIENTELAQIGKSNIFKDKENPVVVHVNRK